MCIGSRRLFGRFYFYSSAFLPAFLASLCAIMVERKSRSVIWLCVFSTIHAYHSPHRRALLAGYVSCLVSTTILLTQSHSFHQLPSVNRDSALCTQVKRIDQESPIWRGVCQLFILLFILNLFCLWGHDVCSILHYTGTDLLPGLSRSPA